jgi:hypothetical protein
MELDVFRKRFVRQVLKLFEHLNLNGGALTLQVQIILKKQNLPAAAPGAHGGR